MDLTNITGVPCSQQFGYSSCYMISILLQTLTLLCDMPTCDAANIQWIYWVWILFFCYMPDRVVISCFVELLNRLQKKWHDLQCDEKKFWRYESTFHF